MPLPTQYPPQPAGWVAPYGYPGVPPPPRRRSNAWIIILVVIVVVVVVLIFAAVFAGLCLFARALAVNVTSIEVRSVDDACGLDGYSQVGFVSSAGATVKETWTIMNSNLTHSCTISSVVSSTAGFVVSSAGVPLTIPAAGSQTLTFEISCPSSFAGVLALDIE